MQTFCTVLLAGVVEEEVQDSERLVADARFRCSALLYIADEPQLQKLKQRGRQLTSLAVLIDAGKVGCGKSASGVQTFIMITT